MGETRLGRSLHVTADIQSADDVIVLGVVDGEISSDANVIVEVGGTVNGGILARSIEIAGEVSGPIRASERIDIRAEASVMGDVRAPRILLADGAKLEGSVHMDRSRSHESVEADED